MRFAPKTKEEIESLNLLKDGVYDFEVFSASDEISKSSGNEMIKLTLNVWSHEGQMHIVYDYLLEAMAYKLRHFAENTGLIQKYESGELKADDCIGKKGKVSLVVLPEQTTIEGKTYPPKNSVKDYVGGKPNQKVELNDDIPF